MKCPDPPNGCGLNINGTADICPRCGRKIPKDNQNINPGETDSKSKNSSVSTKGNSSQGINKRSNNKTVTIICPNPKCGLTFVGPASECPKCLTKITKKDIMQGPIPSGDTSPQPIPLPPPIQPVQWKTNLTTTQNLQREIKNIYGRFEDIAQRNKTIDAEFSSAQSDIKTKHADKLDRIAEEQKQTIKAASAKANTKTKGDVKLGNSLQDSMKRLNALEQSIPHDLKNSYQRKGYYPPIEPDFSSLSSLQTEMLTPSSFGCGTFFILFIVGGVAGLFMSGFDSFGDMVQFSIIGGIIGLIIATVIKLVTKGNNNDTANRLMDSIESGRVYINSRLNEYQNEVTRAGAETERIYKEAKNEAERKYREAKNKAEAQLSSDLSSIEQKRNSKIASLNMEMDALYNDPLIKDVKNRLGSILEELGSADRVWADDFSPLSNYPKEILLGMIESPVTVPKSGLSTLKTHKSTNFLMDTKLAIPFTVLMNSPIQLIINYANDMKSEVMSGVQSFILKLLRFMPLFSFSITYIDPIERGSNLGKLQKLSGIVSFDLYKKVYASREDIQKRLKELEAFVDKTSATLAGIDSVYSYNAQNDSPIIHHFIIINDYPENFDRNAVESLGVLIKNSRKCGISIIFTASGDISSLPADVVSNFRTINVSKNRATVVSDAVSYPFHFDKLTPNCEDFLEKCKTVYNEGIKVDNDFDIYFPRSYYDPPKFVDSTNKMLIPFAVDSRKNLVELELGSPLTAHALLSGTTGSGKSTTLHMLIMSIIMKYHPDDVQLWLVDYKRVEFAEYIENTPPHVKLIGLDRSKEFTFSLLDMIDAEFQHRAELFQQAGVNNIAEYRKSGAKIPRIILVIDEFHEMTQAIQSEPHYSQILENILSEYRAFGLSCVFSDQAISAGLRGLTEKGRLQIRTRLAMSNEVLEIRETLALDSSFYNDELKSKMLGMGVGDVIFKRMYENEIGEAQPIFDRYKTVLVEKDKRAEVIKSITKNTGIPEKRPLVVDGQHRSPFNKEIIDDFEQDNSSIGKQIPLYIGTPASLNPCFYFFLKEGVGSNMMVIGANDELRAAVVYWSIYSFKRQKDFKVYIFADKNDELFTQYNDKFMSLKGENCVVTTELGEMCNVISEIHDSLKPGNVRTLIVWLGLENIAEEFIDLPEKPSTGDRKNVTAALDKSSSSSAVDDLEASLDAMLQEAFGSTSISEILQADSASNASIPKEASPAALADENKSFKETAYNAASDIQDIIGKGSRYSIFTLATYSSYKTLIRDTKFVKADNFEHKIAFNMSMDESSNYLGRSSHASGLDAITAVYYDGTSTTTFRPYLI